MKFSIWGIRVFTLAIIPLRFQYVFLDALTALSMTRLSLLLSLFRKAAYFLATCLLPMFLAAKMAFYAEPIADGLAFFSSSTAFFFIYRKYLRGEGRLTRINF